MDTKICTKCGREFYLTKNDAVLDVCFNCGMKDGSYINHLNRNRPPAPAPTIPTEKFCPKCRAKVTGARTFCPKCDFNPTPLQSLWIAVVFIVILILAASMLYGLVNEGPKKFRDFLKRPTNPDGNY